MKTLRLYQKDVYLKETFAEVLAYFSDDSTTHVILDRTIFFPTGGGQPCDKGTIAGFDVLNVSDKKHHIEKIFSNSGGEDITDINDIIIHTIDTPEVNFKEGDKVPLKINWEHRFDNMQRHCAEHILSGAFFKLFNGANRGFHMGEDYMTIDISIDSLNENNYITWDMAMNAELLANQKVWENLPVHRLHYESKDDIEVTGLRKPVTIASDISIITIGDDNNRADAVACCGTHPARSGEVGLIKIYKLEKNKDMTRVYFDAGRRALVSYQKRLSVLSKLENKLSSGSEGLIEKYDAKLYKHHITVERLKRLSEIIIKDETKRLSEKLATGKSISSRYESLSVDDLIRLGQSLNGKMPKLLLLVQEEKRIVLLFSDNINCGQLIKNTANQFHGRGGGKKDFARISFQATEDMNNFIASLL